jgi:hypothetical protein
VGDCSQYSRRIRFCCNIYFHFHGLASVFPWINVLLFWCSVFVSGVCFASLWIVLVGDMLLFFSPLQWAFVVYLLVCVREFYFLIALSVVGICLLFSHFHSHECGIMLDIGFLFYGLTCLLSFAMVWSVQFGLVSFEFICQVSECPRNLFILCEWMFVISLV